MTAVLGAVHYYEPWYVQIIKSVVIFTIVFSAVPLALIALRKGLGRLQLRYGPNRVGPYGLLQPVADIIKLLSKEQSRPTTSIGWLFILAPIITVTTAAATIALIPFGQVQDIFGTPVGLYGLDVGIGPLYLFAFGAIAFYGIVLGGWASGSKYSFLGAMRGAAQLISYEVSLGLALVGVVITAQSLSLVDIVEAQAGMWYVIPQFVGFLVFVTAGLAEVNHTPFDLVEADAELVSGYNTEYGGGRFAIYFLAELLNTVILAAIATTIFLGGWWLPFGIHPPHWVQPIIVLSKTALMVLFFIWIRGTLPRLRYDQLMTFGWKVLLPIATANVLVTAIIVVSTS
jgi:NADH-quinone oxidoreductase subunit H